MNAGNPEVTRILNATSAGDPHAADELLPLVYTEMRRLAAYRMANEPPGQTLQATALVHEAYLRLSPGEQKWDGRAHFFAAAAEAMRRILVDRARRRKAVQHGGQMRRTTLVEDAITVPSENHDELLAVHEVLDRYAEIEPRKAKVAKLRYFIGMTIEETAEALGVSTFTVKCDWTHARAWLFRELKREAGN